MYCDAIYFASRRLTSITFARRTFITSARLRR
jgi:hypothetical protein